MTAYATPYPDRGVASFEALDQISQKFLTFGSEPPLTPAVGYPMANNTTFAQFSVVGLNAQGKLAMATQDNTVRAIGVLAHSVTLGASGALNGPVFITGNFNIDALVWDASFNTDAKKLAAFNGAPTPTRILTGKRGLSQ